MRFVELTQRVGGARLEKIFVNPQHVLCLRPSKSDEGAYTTVLFNAADEFGGYPVELEVFDDVQSVANKLAGLAR